MSLIYKKASALKVVIGAKVALLRYFLRNFTWQAVQRKRVRSLAGLCGGVVVSLFLTGCETVTTPPAGASGVPMNSSTSIVPSSNVSRLQAWQDASSVAARGEGRASLAGAGESMNPVYGDNTMLVVTPIAYEKLQAGMTVVYINKQGRRVAHQLIGKEKQGWRAQGLNNEVADAELVTPENLVGVVYASMSSDAKE